MQLEGKIAVITGGASGIGKGTALAMARLGVNVVIADVNDRRLEETRAEVAALGSRVLTVHCDVAKERPAGPARRGHRLRDVGRQRAARVRLRRPGARRRGRREGRRDPRRPEDREARRELHFWSGDILEVEAPRIAVLGTDCALGKRTTARFLVEACRRAGLRTELIFTGQTGWMQGAPYGFILDSSRTTSSRASSSTRSSPAGGRSGPTSSSSRGSRRCGTPPAPAAPSSCSRAARRA